MYNNPYIMNSALRGAGGLSKAGLFGSIKSINWGSLLGNTQKTLGIINQAIPIVYQVKPIMNNARTMFKVMGAVRDNPMDNTTAYSNEGVNTPTDATQKTVNTSSNQPMFFI